MDERSCPPEFTFAIRRQIVAAFRAAYAEADALYLPDRGVGDRVHAITVYDVATWHFERDLAEMDGVAFVSRGSGPELRVGDLRVRWNKVGRGEPGHSIGASFPRASRTAAEMAAANRQLTLWSNADGVRPLNWIICHLGNPRDGLRAIYLAAPIEVDGERIVGWRSATPIWNADDPAAEFPAAPPLGLPESVRLPDLEISLLDEPQSANAPR